MIELTKEQLIKLRETQLEMAIEMDRICKKHNINYYIAGGTLIGAVRHKGYIPWDDDFDVYMYRPEYEKFCRVCDQELDKSRFFWQTQETDIYYRWTYGKLRRKDTLYIREGQEHMKFFQGIFIDILPVDKRPKSRFLYMLQEKNARICRRILWSPVGAFNERNYIKRKWYQFLSLIPRDIVYDVYKKGITFYNKTSSKIYCTFNVTWNYQDSNGIQEDWVKETIDLEFENYKFPAPKNYDAFLRHFYGDYMKLPPLEERHGNAPASTVKFLD